MSNARASFYNPGTGTLVIDSEATNYGYIGQPTLQTTGSIVTATGFAPYKYRIVMPDNVNPPIVVVKPVANVATYVEQSYLISGTTWEFTCYSVSTSSVTIPGYRNTTVVAPLLYVWGPMVSSGSGAVMRLWNSAGTLAFDSNNHPLWLKGTCSFSAHSGSASTDAAFTGDSSAIPSGITTPGVIGPPYQPTGDHDAAANSFYNPTGDDADYWIYGWSLSGSNLLRRRFWLGTDRATNPYDPPNTSDFSMSYSLTACTALLIDLDGY